MKALKSAKTPLTMYRPRPGERDSLDVVHQVFARPDGTSVATIGINLSTAPVPDRRYVTDVAGVIYRKGTVKLIFAQESLSLDLRSMIVVQMSAHSARAFVKSLRQVSGTSIDEIAALSGVQAESLINLTSEFKEPDQTIAFAVDMVSAAVAGQDACFDCYNASAFSLAHVAKTSKLPIEAVVRVDLSTALLLSIRDAIQELEQSFPPDVVVE